jgi:hypothetical protein
MFLISLFQQANIDEKIKNAPDNGYLMVVLGWWMYIRAKKRQNDE